MHTLLMHLCPVAWHPPVAASCGKVFLFNFPATIVHSVLGVIK